MAGKKGYHFGVPPGHVVGLADIRPAALPITYFGKGLMISGMRNCDQSAEDPRYTIPKDTLILSHSQLSITCRAAGNR